LITGGLIGINQGGSIWECYATGTILGDFFTGGLVGANQEGGAILICYADSTVDGNFVAGALVGVNSDTISNCSATGTVFGTTDSGGLVGANSGRVSNCYATTSVSGDYETGGLVGYNDGLVFSSYAAGLLTNDDPNTGGLVGSSETNSTYSMCFWDSNINPDINGIGNVTDPNVIGESTENMQTESTFSGIGWDFVGETVNGANDIWWINEGKDYPRLWWETIEPVELLDILAQDVIDLELQPGLENSLLAKLDAALQKLEDDNENNDAATINLLEAFINTVEAQRGKKIPEADADALIAAAQEIIDLLSG